MRVLYIDVYFLINFTVDLLALYFSALILHFPTVRWRLALSAAIGAFYASLSVLLYGQTVFLVALSVILLFVMIALISPRASAFRRMKLLFLFLLMQMLLGGIVSLGYDFLKRALAGVGIEGGVENRKLLYLAVLILIALGILRIAIGLISGSMAEESVEVGISVFGKKYYGSALVDSGCFLSDPMDGTAVVLLKRSAAARLLPEALLLENTSRIPIEYQKRLRLIPMRIFGVRRILFGIRPDEFFVCKNSRKERIKVILAYDKEDGDYEGYKVLIPSAIVRNV